jgi:hypothetical protein
VDRSHRHDPSYELLDRAAQQGDVGAPVDPARERRQQLLEAPPPLVTPRAERPFVARVGRARRHLLTPSGCDDGQTKSSAIGDVR